MKFFFSIFVLLLSVNLYAQEISEMEVIVSMVVSSLSMFIPVIALIFIVIRKSASFGNKVLWGFIYLLLWYVLGRFEFLLMLLSLEWAFYIQITSNVLITVLFVMLFYKFTRPKEIALDEVSD